MEVLKTKDYSKLKFFEKNRSLKENHVEKLKASMKKSGFWASSPIEVNRDYEILDGQHRYLAAKEMGLELLYTVVDHDDTYMFRKNSLQRDWKPADYLRYWETSGKWEYVYFNDFMKAHDFLNISLTRQIVSCATGDFKEGRLIINDAKQERASKLISQIEEVANILGKSFGSAIVRALIQMMLNPLYSQRKMLIQAEKAPSSIKKARTYEGYLYQLEEMYNFSVPYKNRINFKLASSTFSQKLKC